jgi:hypothetical protein
MMFQTQPHVATISCKSLAMANKVPSFKLKQHEYQAAEPTRLDFWVAAGERND